MWENPKEVQGKKPNTKKLSQYGFAKQGDEYIFAKDISGGEFFAEVFISEGSTRLRVMDKATGEEYVPVYVEGAVGVFVGAVRAECEALIEDIADRCFDENIFKEKNTAFVLKYIEEKYGIKAEYLWKKTPKNCIFRVAEGQKWFAALLSVEYKKLGIDKGGEVEIINFKETPENIEKLFKNSGFIPGYHMNKKYWYTVLLDGTVPVEEIYKCIDRSYELILNNKEKIK